MTQPPLKRTSTTPQKPRQASVAAASSAKQYKAAQLRTAQAIAMRKRLPRTQQDLYAQRVAQR